MIVGIGTDLVEIERVRRVLESPVGDKFLHRILTDAELDMIASRHQRRVEFTAGRFAAKEAVVKAIGCGIGEAVGFRDITIMPDKLGKPECQLSERSSAKLGIKETDRLLVTISHTGTHAVAFAIWERVDVG